MMSRDDTREWWRIPAATTVFYVILTILGFTAILLFVQYHVTDERLVGTLEYRLWITTNAVSLSVWFMLLTRGIAMIHAFPENWKRGKAWWTGSVIAYAVLAFGALLMMMLIRSGVEVRPPVRGFVILEGALTLIAVIAAAPWVLMLWLTHEQVRRSNLFSEGIKIPEPADEFRYEALDAAAIKSAVVDALAVWRTIEACALALALLVSMGVLDSGAFRMALIESGVIEKASFPPRYVLFYGAYFAALLAAAVVPLVFAWRTLVIGLVDRAVGRPKSGVPSESWVAARLRLEGMLRLDASLIKRPITVLTLLSPLVTAMLTAAIPNTW